MTVNTADTLRIVTGVLALTLHRHYDATRAYDPDYDPDYDAIELANAVFERVRKLEAITDRLLAIAAECER